MDMHNPFGKKIDAHEMMWIKKLGGIHHEQGIDFPCGLYCGVCAICYTADGDETFKREVSQSIWHYGG